MKRNAEYKDLALTHLRGNWINPIVATLIVIVIEVATNLFTNGPKPHSLSWGITKPIIGLALTIFVAWPITYGFSLAFLDYIRGDKDNLNNKIFQGFNVYWRSVGVQFFRFLYTFLWTLLLIVPGIIKAYAYSMTLYISKDHPELDADACIDLSIAMMKGHKAQLFWLHLSFIGWIILCILTLGIGTLWIKPYMECSIAHFYEDVKSEYEGTVATA